MGVVVREERAVLEIQRKGTKVAEVIYSTHVYVDSISPSHDSKVRKQIMSFQEDDCNVTIESIKLNEGEDLYYVFINLNQFLRSSGYSKMGIYVLESERKKYEELGFTMLTYIQETNGRFMVKKINLWEDSN